MRIETNGKKWQLYFNDKYSTILNFDTEREAIQTKNDFESDNTYYLYEERHNGYNYIMGKGSGWSGTVSLRFSNDIRDAKIFQSRAEAERYVKHEPTECKVIKI